jgi:general secretion pathway protein D
MGVAALLMAACAPQEIGLLPLETSPAQQAEPIKPAVVSSSGVQPILGSPSAPARTAPPQVVPGTGEFAHPTAPDTSAAPTLPDGDVTFNFVNADVHEVVRELLGEQLHLQYVVDPKVQGTVTAQTGGPIPRSAVLSTLESILRTSGIALVQAGGVYRAVPIEDATRGSVASLARPGSTQAGYAIRVLPLKFIQAGELKPILDPFVPTGGVLEVDGARNLLIVSGPSADLDGFGELVRQFDVDWLSGKSFAIYPLRVGKAKEITTELQAILAQGSDGSGPLAGLVRVVPIERLNAVLVIASRSSYLTQMRSWVDKLDYGNANATPRFFTYQVQKTRAVDLARVLREMFSSADVKIVRPEKSPLPNFTRLASPVSTSGTTGTSAFPGAAAAVPPATPPPPPPADNSDQPGGATGTRPPDLELPAVRIVADEKNNTLVIFARPSDYRTIEEMLRRLDIAPQQVMIDATVAELTLNDALQYGLQYFLKDGSHRAEFSVLNSGTLTAADIAGVFPGFNYIIAASQQHLILNLLQSLTKVRVLSSPQLLIRDNHTAGLQVGAQVPIVIQSAESVISPGAPIVNSIEYRNTGVILEVTPRINADGAITLEIDQEVSDVATTTTSTIDSPTINDRHLVSSVIVKDGETIALAGLIRDETNDTRNGIPVLSQIPVVGPLFRDTSRSAGRSELIILLTPRVVRNSNDAHTMTEDLRRQIQGLQPLNVHVKR